MNITIHAETVKALAAFLPSTVISCAVGSCLTTTPQDLVITAPGGVRVYYSRRQDARPEGPCVDCNSPADFSGHLRAAATSGSALRCFVPEGPDSGDPRPAHVDGPVFPAATFARALASVIPHVYKGKNRDNLQRVFLSNVKGVPSLVAYDGPGAACASFTHPIKSTAFEKSLPVETAKTAAAACVALAKLHPDTFVTVTPDFLTITAGTDFLVMVQLVPMTPIRFEQVLTPAENAAGPETKVMDPAGAVRTLKEWAKIAKLTAAGEGQRGARFMASPGGLQIRAYGVPALAAVAPLTINPDPDPRGELHGFNLALLGAALTFPKGAKVSVRVQNADTWQPLIATAEDADLTHTRLLMPMRRPE